MQVDPWSVLRQPGRSRHRIWGSNYPQVGYFLSFYFISTQFMHLIPVIILDLTLEKLMSLC